jgi:outer membrane protein OmpA-like peptidoglycan-associated protein
LTLNDNEISQSGLEHQLMASSNSKPVANNFRRTILGTGIAHFEKGEYKLGAGKGFMSNNFRNSFEKEAGELVNKGIADNPSGSGVLAKVAPLSEFIGFKQNSSKYLPNYDGNNNGKTNQQEVDNVVNKLANNPDYTISMTGGASSEGNASANYTLSQNRINTVMGVLQNAGIGASRINNTAQGSSNLLSTEPSQNSKQNESINRNVQVKYNGPPK